MITIHPSMNLIKRIRPYGGNEGTVDAEHIMRTWYCSYRIVRSRHMVMALNEETLLPVVAPLTSMTKTAGPTLQRLVLAGLYSFGIPGEIIVRECAAMGAWSVEKRINRSMTGWMNDIWRSVVYMIDDGLSDAEIACRVTDWIYGSIPRDVSPSTFTSPYALAWWRLLGIRPTTIYPDREIMFPRWREGWGDGLKQ